MRVLGRLRKTRRWRVVTAGLVVVAVGAGTGAWMLVGEDTPETAETTTATVSSTTVRDTVAVTGTIAPANETTLDFSVSGTVTKVLVEPGDTVRRGDALVRVDATALVATRAAALASLAAAEAQLDEDEDAGASDLQVTADESSILAEQSKVSEARAAVEGATLRATIRGTVTAVGVAVGDTVGSTQSGGESVATTDTASGSGAAVDIVTTNRFVLDATVAAADVGELTEGLQAEITVSGVTDTVYGTVSEVARVAEVDSDGAAVFPVVVAVTGTRDDLYSGTSADATVIVQQLPDVLTVSTPALQSDGDTTYVEKVVDGVAERVDVETGTTYGIATEVVSGLSEGDVVEVPGFTRGTGGGTGTGTDTQRPQRGDLEGGPPADGEQTGP